MPFLENVTRGRNIPRERLAEVAEHYYHFGGKSPINDQNRALIAALQSELKAQGIELPIYWGNRNWQPYLADALQAMRDDGGETHWLSSLRHTVRIRDAGNIGKTWRLRKRKWARAHRRSISFECSLIIPALLRHAPSVFAKPRAIPGDERTAAAGRYCPQHPFVHGATSNYECSFGKLPDWWRNAWDSTIGIWSSKAEADLLLSPGLGRISLMHLRSWWNKESEMWWFRRLASFPTTWRSSTISTRKPSN